MATIASRSTTVKASSQPTIFANGLDRIEAIGGGCLRIVLFENQEIDGRTVRVELPNPIIMPIEALPDAIGKALAALGRQVVVNSSGVLSVLH